MLCRKVLPLLSQFFDEVLDAETAGRIARHLSSCPECRKEYDSLAALHRKLRSMPRIPPPAYLRGLIGIRIADLARDEWRVRLREAMERAWSRIRTVESMWYVTKALGTVAASAFFFLITYTLTPINVSANAPKGMPVSLSADYGQQVGMGVLEKLGLIPAQPQKGYARKRQPAINDLYFLNYGKSVPRAGQDDTFSVVTVVDPSGAATIQNVLEYPTDQDLLISFVDMISSARCRPASRNGEAVTSHLVLMFSKVSVYD